MKIWQIARNPRFTTFFAVYDGTDLSDMETTYKKSNLIFGPFINQISS
jgi:hypothetical protein